MKIEELIDGGEQTAQNVRSVLNILLESPYFYKTDDERLFLVLMRYKRAFEAFFDKFFGWSLVMDAKCARLYKPKWFNEKITLPNRDMFTFTKRDDCMAFLLVLEFFECECREQGVTADDRENLRFRFGDLLEYAAARFRALMSGRAAPTESATEPGRAVCPHTAESYTDERVRQILKGIMPQLEKYRFLRKVKPSADDSVSEAETIFECLPAMWHYQAAQLAQSIGADGKDGVE